jgi:hypothetical protein
LRRHQGSGKSGFLHRERHVDSPLLIEQQFQNLRQALLLITSRRRKLLRILEFAEPLVHSSRADYLAAYATDLLPELCWIVPDTHFAGTHPSFLSHCEQLIQLLVDNSESEEFSRDADSALNHLRTERERILAWVRLRPEEQADETLLSSSGRRVRPGTAGWIPLVERELLIAQRFRHFAGLRHLIVEVEFSASDDDVLHTPGLSERNGKESAIASSLVAARALASGITRIDMARPVLVRSRFAPIRNAETDIITGESFGAGLAVLLFCELLRLHRHREQFFLRNNVAITGCIDHDGLLLPVDPYFLRAKIEACTFSWIRHLAVPAEQEQFCSEWAATVARENSLSEDVPGEIAPVNIIGARTIQEVVSNPHLVRSQKVHFIAHFARKGWEKKGPLTMAMFLILLAIIWRLWYGPIDRNPTSFTYQGGVAQIRNAQHQIIDRITAGNGSPLEGEPGGKKRPVAFFDIDRDCTNEVFWIQQPSPGTSSASTVLCKSVASVSPLWSFALREPLAFTGSIDPGSLNFYSDQLIVNDLDDGDPEVVLAARHSSFPQWFLS